MPQVDVSIDHDGLHCLTWPQRAGQTGKTYVISVRQLPDRSVAASAATAQNSTQEWTAVLTSPSCNLNTVKLDTCELSYYNGGLLEVDVLECSSMHKQGRWAERYFNILNIGSADVEIYSQDYDDVFSLMSRLHITSLNSRHRNSK